MAIGQAAAPPATIEVPKDCTVLIVGGPQTAIPQPAVDASRPMWKRRTRALHAGQRAPDRPFRSRRENPELASVLAGWGVTVNKDLVLDLSGVGQIFGFGPKCRW